MDIPRTHPESVALHDLYPGYDSINCSSRLFSDDLIQFILPREHDPEYFPSPSTPDTYSEDYNKRNSGSLTTNCSLRRFNEEHIPNIRKQSNREAVTTK